MTEPSTGSSTKTGTSAIWFYKAEFAGSIPHEMQGDDKTPVQRQEDLGDKLPIFKLGGWFVGICSITLYFLDVLNIAQ